MALGLKILYPTDLVDFDKSASLVEYGAKYLVTTDDNGLVTIRFRAVTYDNFGTPSEIPSVLYPVAQVEISNNANFEGNNLLLTYAERKQYDVATTTLSNITAGDMDYASQCMRITNWPLDQGEGPKTAYLRFITSGTPNYTFPDPNGVYLGYSDTIIVVRYPASIPVNERVENATTNDYVAADTVFSWQESQDNISGLRGYDFDLTTQGILGTFNESCDDLSDFDILDPDVERARLASGLPVIRTRVSSALLPSDVSLTEVSGESKILLTFVNTGATLLGHEMQFVNTIDEEDPTNFEFRMRFMPEFPDDDGSSSAYVAFQNLRALYSGGRSVDATGASVNVIYHPVESGETADGRVNVAVPSIAGRGYMPRNPMNGKVKIVQRKVVPNRSVLAPNGKVTVEAIGVQSEEIGSVSARTDSFWLHRSEPSNQDYFPNENSLVTQQLSKMFLEDNRKNSGVSDGKNYLEVKTSPDGIHGFQFIQLCGGNKLVHSGGSFTAIGIFISYAPDYGVMSVDDLKKCHIKVTPFWYTSPNVTEDQEVTSKSYKDEDIWGQYDDPTGGSGRLSVMRTWEGMSVAHSSSSYYSYLSYTNERSTSSDGSSTWETDISNDDLIWFRFPEYETAAWYELYETYRNSGNVSLKIEIWADDTLGHPIPTLRIPFLYGQTNDGTFKSAGLVNGLESLSWENAQKHPIYNPDGSVQRYREDVYDLGQLSHGPSGGAVAAPLIRLGDIPLLKRAVDAPSGRVVVTQPSGGRARNAIPASITVLAREKVSTSRDQIPARADIFNDALPNSNFDAISARVDVAMPIGRTGFRTAEGNVNVFRSEPQRPTANTIPAKVMVERATGGVDAVPARVTVTDAVCSVDAITARIKVVAPWNRDPIYVDIADAATVINSTNKTWQDYILFEMNSDGTYAMVRPTWDGGGVITGYTRQTLSTADTLLEFNDLDQIVEVDYRENRVDVEETASSDFGFEEQLYPTDTSAMWEENPVTILWQEFIATEKMTSIKKITIRVENADSGPGLFWCEAAILPVGEDGLPIVVDSTTKISQRTSLLRFVTDDIFRSCSWVEGSSYPEFDTGNNRRWSETVRIMNGTSDVTLAKKMFTGSSAPTMTLTPGIRYMLCLSVVRIDNIPLKGGASYYTPGSDDPSDPNWQLLPFRPSITWKSLNIPVDGSIPEKTVSVRSMTTGTLRWGHEFKATEDTSSPAIFRMSDSSLVTVHSTYPSDLNSDAELIVSWMTYSGDSVRRVSEVFPISALRGNLRTALTGARSSLMGMGAEADVTYDNIRYSDHSRISNIDLSGDTGYTRESLNPDEEDVAVLVTVTEWTDEDWGKSWSKRYGKISGVSITNPTGDLIFSTPAGDPDDLTRSGEAHYLSPTEGKSFSTTIDVDLSAETLDTEFYVAVLPSSYDSNVAEISQISDNTPQDFLLIGLRFNGNIYLHRPNYSTGIVESELIRTLGQFSPYDWSVTDVKIRVTNDVPGSTGLYIWHGSALVYRNDALDSFLPESDRGFWLALGFRSKREVTGALRLDVGNILTSEVSRGNSDLYISTLNHESFGDVPIRWFVWPMMEEVHPGGSQVMNGLTNDSSDTDYTSTHRLVAPTNVYAQPIYAIGIPAADTLDPEGAADYYRMRMGVSTDDVTMSELTELERWIGPNLVSAYGITGATTSRSFRIDMNYELSYSDQDGDSEVMFGLANWMPTNAAATVGGVVASPAYSAYSFTELDYVHNTKAIVPALKSDGTTITIGLENEQYVPSMLPKYVLISFASNGGAFSIVGSNVTPPTASSAPVISSLGQSYLPSRGRISLIITPQGTAISPDRCDVEIRINNVMFVKASGASFTFNTTDGAHLVCAARRKTPGQTFDRSATVSKFSMTYINQRAMPSPEDSLSIALWEKTDGNISANTLFYGRNIDRFVQEDLDHLIPQSMFSGTGMPSGTSELVTGNIVSQRFTAIHQELRAVSLRMNATSGGLAVAYVCALTSDEPNITITSGCQHVDPANANILGTAWARYSAGMRDAFFIFNDVVTLTPSTKYAIVFDGVPSAYGTGQVGILPAQSAMVWNLTVWEDSGMLCGFRTFSDFYTNRVNQHHGKSLYGYVAATNNAGLTSDSTPPTRDVIADLIAPLYPGSTTLPPVLSVQGGTAEADGFIVHLQLQAQDTFVIGSGMKDFRIIYEGDFGEQNTTDWMTWNDPDDDDIVEFDMFYEGIFLDTRRYYAQVRDLVGNIATTETISVIFDYEYTADTTSPSLVRIRIEGNAFIDPDPDEAEATKEDIAEISLNVVDETSGCMDFRLNRNFEEDANGNLIFDEYQHYLEWFQTSLVGPDGVYSLAVQARDYGFNATQSRMEQIEKIDFGDNLTTGRTEMPIALTTYTSTPTATDKLHVATTRRTSRANLEGVEKRVIGHIAYTVYEAYSGGSKQFFKANEMLAVTVNGTVTTAFTRDGDNCRVIFSSAKDPSDTIRISIVEEVAVLYRYDGSRKTSVKTFDVEDERAIMAMVEYNGILYLGMDSGNIYAYNGIRTSLPIYTVLDGSGDATSVSSMMVGRFDVDDRDYLFIGTFVDARMYQYGGNIANTAHTWKLSDISALLTSEDSIYAIEMYEGMMFVATGPNGKVYRVSKSESGTYSASSTRLYADKFTDDPGFTLNILCLRTWDGRIYAGVDYNSSVFVYQYAFDPQPSSWTSAANFNLAFENNPLPWEYYRDGNVDHRHDERVSFTQVRDDITGEISEWYISLDGKTDEYCLFVDRSSESSWQDVSNSTGWTLEFKMRIGSFGANADAFQGIDIYDGTYHLELRIRNGNILFLSGDSSFEKIFTFDATEWHTYRLLVHNNSIALHVDGDDTSLVDLEDFMTFDTHGRSLLFGKTAHETADCLAHWTYLEYLITGAVAPHLITEHDFTREQVLPFGKEVRHLEIGREGLVAGVQPREPSDFEQYDDPSTIVPRTYLRIAGPVSTWTHDTTYHEDDASLIAATVWNDKVLSLCEYSADPMTNDPMNLKEYALEDPHLPMTKNGRAYERRTAFDFDTILKDTKAPSGSLLINEEGTAGSMQVYSLESYTDATTRYTMGVAATFSSIDEEIGSASAVIDGDPDTYVSVGIGGVRYIKHDYGGDGETTIELSVVKWGVKSSSEKTYRIEYLGADDAWHPIVEMISSSTGDERSFSYALSSKVSAKALRLYFTGARQTVSEDVTLTISSIDEGVGTAAYKLSAFSDFRDATDRTGADVNGWVAMTDGIIQLPWSLTTDADNWQVMEDGIPIPVAGVEFASTMVVGCIDGSIYISTDGDTYQLSPYSAGSRINCFTEWNGVLYMGTADGIVHSTENGLAWIEVVDTGQDRVSSLAVYDDTLFIGTGDSGYLYSWDGTSITTRKKFTSEVVSAMATLGTGSDSRLHLAVSPTGEFYRFDGIDFSSIANTPATFVNQIVEHSDGLYAACDRGSIYSYVVPTSGSASWSVLLDTSRRRISGVSDHMIKGPTIIDVTEDGTGNLLAGTYHYAITFVDHAGVESVAGEAYEIEDFTTGGRFHILWQSIESARGYRIYRTVEPNQSESDMKMLDIDELADTDLYDDGTIGFKNLETDSAKTPIHVSPPTNERSNLWFCADQYSAYLYDGVSVSEIALPEEMRGANAIVDFGGQVYFLGQVRPFLDAELDDIEVGGPIPVVDGVIIRFVGISVGSGDKVVYAMFKDEIDNEGDAIADTIFYNNLIEHQVIQVTEDGVITDSYESQSSPQQKLYSPVKTIEQIAIYECQPFYASNLSRWDVAQLLALLPYDTEVDLYVRTADTREELLEAEWEGPFELANTEEDIYYFPSGNDVYYGYYDEYGYPQGYNVHYDYSYYYEGPGRIMTETADISYMEGAWLQFKLVLRTHNRGYSPAVFYVVIRYRSTNAAMFFTSVFDLDDLADRERVSTGGRKISRGELTYNGEIPESGDIRFGIATLTDGQEETRDWSDYLEITPNRTFEIPDPQGRFKVGIMLISTDVGVSIVDEFAFSFESIGGDVKINFDRYESLSP